MKVYEGKNKNKNIPTTLEIAQISSIRWVLYCILKVNNSLTNPDSNTAGKDFCIDN